MIVAGSEDGKAYLWDLQTKTLMQVGAALVALPRPPLPSPSLSPSGLPGLTMRFSAFAFPHRRSRVTWTTIPSSPVPHTRRAS